MAPGTPLRSNRGFVFFGARFPAVIVWLVGVILVGSCVGAVDYRAGLKLLDWVTLGPTLVFRGEIWRLATWSFFELAPINLIFACLVLLFVGRDLSDVWGSRRLLGTYVVLTVATGVLTVVLGWAVGRIWPEVWGTPYLTAWPIAEAFIIAWALTFPTRQLLVYFVLPLGGRNLVYVTLGGTLVFALLQGFAPFVPHFIAQGLMLVYLREPGIGQLWQRLTLRGGRKRKPRHLRAVDRFDRDEDPPRWLH